MLLCEGNLLKGSWSPKEDNCLRAYVTLLGESRWDAMAKATGLRRSGKSCRLRWLNYLHPSLKHSRLSVEEEQLIIRLHQKWGNKWARIARRLPGRTDNEIKNYWRAYTRKKTTVQSIDQAKEDSDKNVMHSTPNSSNLMSCSHDEFTKVEEHSIQMDGAVSRDELMTYRSSVDQRVCSDAALMHAISPYEDHFSNWMSLLPTTASEGYGGWSYQEGNTSAVMNCSDTLGDLDLFRF